MKTFAIFVGLKSASRSWSRNDLQKHLQLHFVKSTFEIPVELVDLLQIIEEIGQMVGQRTVWLRLPRLQIALEQKLCHVSSLAYVFGTLLIVFQSLVQTTVYDSFPFGDKKCCKSVELRCALAKMETRKCPCRKFTC
jgi:hypothetical protein